MDNKKINFKKNRKTNIVADRKIFYFLGMIIFIFFMISNVSAHFVCGKVNDSIDNVTSDWISVNAYPYNYPNKITSCKVSPNENKYCCDLETIDNYKWKIGDNVITEVFDNESGYVSGPVSIILTGEGYDVMPEMMFEKAMNIYSPDKRLILSNSTIVMLNLSTIIDYNNIDVYDADNYLLGCDDCNILNENLNFSFGVNKLKIITSSVYHEIIKNIEFFIINYLIINRTYECEKCNNNILPSHKEIDIRININVSDKVNGIEVIEYVPKDFEVIDSGGGILRSYSETHNRIIFNISGDNVDLSYKVLSPKIWFLPKVYEIKTEIEGKIYNEEKVIVKWIFPFFKLKKYFKYHNIKKSAYIRITPKNPIVIKPKSDIITKIVIIPKKDKKNVYMGISKDYHDEQLDDIIKASLTYYNIYSNLDSEDVDKMYLEFKVKKDLLKEDNNLKFVIKKYDEFEYYSLDDYNNDSEFNYYKGYFPYTENIIIIKE